VTDPLITEAVILVRQGTRTMAVHRPTIWLNLEAILDEPPIPIPDPVAYYRGPSVTGYAVQAEGTADRLTIWEGPDPFDRLPIEPANPADVNAADLGLPTGLP